MPNKKIWAYAKDKNKEYIIDNGRLKLFFIWSVSKMKRLQTEFYETLTFWSTQREEHKRKPITPVRTGFFRYNEANDEPSGYSGDGESLSHSMAIVALSQLSEIPFTIGENKYLFKFREMRAEDLKIEFETGRYYYPDLFGFFTEPQHLVEKWGGKVAIEVKVSHGCEPIKIRDFEDHNIAIIEVTLGKNMQFLKEQSGEPFDEEDMENYYNFIYNKFRVQVFGKILSDPVMIHYQKRIQLSYAKHMDLLKAKNKALSDQLRSIESTSLILQTKLEAKTDKVKICEAQNTELLTTLDKIKNKSFIDKLLDLF